MITLAFYKAPGTIINAGIRLRTGSQYSHCEIIFNGVWFSMGTRLRDGFRARFKLITPKRGHWDFIDIPVDDCTDALRFAMAKEGAGYAWLQILFAHAIELNLNEKKRFTCSEICALCLQYALIKELQGIAAHTIDPGELFAILSKHYTTREG